MLEKHITTRRLDKITEKEDNILKDIADHYRLSHDKVSQALRMFLNDVKDYNLLDLMEKKIEDDYLNIPINIVNKISRSKIMSNKKSGKKSDEVNEYVKRNPKAKEYPVIIQATAYIIEQIELGERVTNASVRQVINCDYKVAKLAMDIIDDLYIPKNTRMKSFF